MIGFLFLGLAVTLAACGVTSTGESTPAASPPPLATPPPTYQAPTIGGFTAVAATLGSTITPTPRLLTQPTPASEQPGPVVLVGDIAFPVELAITAAQRTQGLSGRPNLAPGTGMLFIFEQEAIHSFWMKDMHFPLDMVWINAQCVIVDITRSAKPPAPDQTTADLPRYTPAVPALYVLEINAGEAESGGIRLGDNVQYAGSLTGLYGC